MSEETKEDITPQQNLVFTAANSGHHTWVIHDDVLIQDILTSKNGDMFESIPFEMAKLRWTIQLYPNGGNQTSKGSVMIRLRLLSQSCIHKIQLICSILCNKTMSCSTYEAMLTTECGWISRVLLLSEWISLNPQYLSITVSVHILKLILTDQYSHLLLAQLKLNTVNSQYSKTQMDLNYKHKLKFTYVLSKQIIEMFQHTYYGKRFESDIFNNMWRLVIYPKNWAKDKQSQMYIGLHLCCAPIHTQGITAKYWIVCKELQHKKWHKTVDFSYKSPTSGSGKFITLSEIGSLPYVTFEITVEIIKIIGDMDQKTNELHDLGSEINIWNPKQIDYILTSQVYQKDDRVDKMMQEIKGLRSRIQQKDVLMESLKQQMMKQQQMVQLLCDRMVVIENEKKSGNGLNRINVNGGDNNNRESVNKTILLVDDIIKQIPKFTF